jgi:dolichol-phosphate mannosyltransferase
MLCTVVVPCYNEQEVLAETYKRLTEVMAGLDAVDYELLFVNDGSRDATLPMLRELHAADKRVKVVSFARNFGHQIAVSAGMDKAAGDAVVIIDADLQDPPSVIPKMLEKWREGYQVVYGQRVSHRGIGLFKRITAKMFYAALGTMADKKVKIPRDVGDFRLLDRKVVDVMNAMPERNRFLRGIGSWVGFKQIGVEFAREERFAGVTKYPLKSMVKLAIDGMVSFSYKPLGLATTLGILVSVLAKGGFLAALVLFILGHKIGAAIWLGLASIFLSGVTMCLLGIIGTYIARICDEVRGRPLYIIGETIGLE